MRDQLICAWLSSHKPTAEQRLDLTGYDIRQIHSRSEDCELRWQYVLLSCNRAPDLVMLVVAHKMITPMVRLLDKCAPGAEIIRPYMVRLNGVWHWTGVWQQMWYDRKTERTASGDWNPGKMVRR